MILLQSFFESKQTSSQRFNFDYNQIVSGGFLKTNLTVDSTFENQNSDKWLKDGSIVNNLNTNINEKFNRSHQSFKKI